MVLIKIRDAAGPVTGPAAEKTVSLYKGQSRKTVRNIKFCLLSNDIEAEDRFKKL